MEGSDTLLPHLDTELGDTDLDHAAKVLAESGYTCGQLEEILYVELHPVLIGNLRCVAGEWAGFDQQWLEQQVLKAKPRRGPFAIVLGKWMVRDGWQKIEARIREAGRPRYRSR